ncbi:MAG TPA: C-type lectin domain-containing protein, partial [Kofleriaceae bacterium]|nr:C-type lectin domain-containing protein [Kofleriaceae bacterium]
PSSYTLHDSSRPHSFYKQVTASVTWSVAEVDCESDEVPTVTAPAHLLVLDDQSEAAYAWSTNNSNQWAGHTDTKTEGTWLPITDQPTVFTGAASGNNSSKDCLEVTQSSGQTTAESCTQTRPYLCECDGNAADAANVSF